MSYTTRILPPAEWPAMGTPFELLPESSQVIVIEHDGEIVGRWVLTPIWHAEFLEIAPAHQGKASVARRLYVEMLATARRLGVQAVYTGAMDDQVRDLLAHVGATKLPGDHYIWEMH